MEFRKVNGPVLNYKQFIDWTTSLVASNDTSGENKTPELIKYTALNLKRMERLNKTIVLNEALKNSVESIEKNQIWYVITETWCGDSAQNLPLIGKLSEIAGEKIILRIIQRDLNLDWIDQYLTNGTRSIPKFVAFDEQGKELFQWGPRPELANILFKEWKKNPEEKTWEDFEIELHTWYAKDKTQSQQKEMSIILENANKS